MPRSTAATTAEDAQAAYDAVKDDVSAAQGERLQAAVDDRIAALAKMARVTAQKAALATAAAALAAIDTDNLPDADAIGAAKAAITTLQTALNKAVDVDPADKAMYQSQLSAAETAVETAEATLNTQQRVMAQRSTITSAVAAARTAVNAVNDDSTDAEVMEAETAIAALKTAIDGAEGLIPEGDAGVAEAKGTLATLEGNLESAKTSRTAKMEADAEAKRMAAAEEAKKKAAAMAATAAKLYAGISAQMGSLAADGTGFAANDRDAAYNTAGTAINLSIGGETAPTALTATLSEDKKTMVADHHGWKGKRYTHSVTSGDDKGDMYEAIVYSDVGAPTMGAKFSAEYPDTATFVTEGVVTVDTTGTNTPASRVAIDSFNLSAGTKTFPLPDPNNIDAGAITEPGSFHGVRGMYKCVPTSGETCSASLATKGLTLAGGTWTFTPTNAAHRVTETADDAYSSYGWWLRTKADGSLTASAFVDDKGTAPTTNVTTLVAGSATYRGGAAGKYALSSSTGGTNDAGHFTARATLEADFEKDEVTGTIDRFMGADGQSRDWTVELKKSALFNDGTVIGDPARDGIDLTAATADDVRQKTVWTIGGTAAAAAGEWTGALKDTAATKTDTTGVPKVATGTFYSTYGQDGKMVGAFGAKK